MTDIKNAIAKQFLPIKDCCGKGCKKCNYGRWIKRREQTWYVLIDECIKRMPPWLWSVWLVFAFILGYAAGGI